RQPSDESSVLKLMADSSAVFAIERDVEQTHTCFRCHVGLQLQAFLHALRRTAVVVTDRNRRKRGLRPLQNFARMLHGVSDLQQVGNASLLVRQFLERLVNALLTESIDIEAAYHLVFAV